MKNRLASQIALAFVVVVVGASFFFWFRDRPAYILYRAHKGVGNLDQSAAIAEYRKLLRSKSLTKEQEIEYRVELGALYLRALEESAGFSRYVLSDPNQPSHPFLDDAKKEFDRVLKMDPENARAHLHLGQILWLRNLEGYAIEELEIGRKKDPTNPSAFRYLSTVFLQRGDLAKARDLALQALAIDPTFDEARLALIEAYAQLGDNLSALREFDKLSPGFQSIPLVRAQHALYLAKQNFWTESTAEIELATQSSPNSGPIKIIYGQLLLDRGLIDPAIGAFSQAQDLLPRNVWPMVHRARALMMRGNCDEVERVGQLVTSAWPRWPWGRLVESWSALCKEDDRRAISELDEAIRLSPDFTEALQQRAEIYADRGQFEKLGLAVRPMLDQKLLEVDAHVFLAFSLLGQNKLDLAAEMAETAIRMNQRSHRAFLALAEVRANARDVEGAERAFASARALNPFDAEIEARYLRFAARTGRGAAAEEGFKELALKEPHAPAVWVCWGDAQILNGQYADAVLSYQNALSKRPHLLWAHLGLVEAYARQKNGYQASIALGRASEINPRHPDVMAWRSRLMKS